MTKRRKDARTRQDDVGWTEKRVAENATTCPGRPACHHHETWSSSFASLPGLLSTTTIFGVREELPEQPQPGTVGLVLAEGPVVGESALPPGYFADHLPPALLMLHPPSETTPSLPECTGAASGCVLLPGLPYLGLDHRAAWVEAEFDGTVTSMVSRVGVDPISHPDTAILAMLLAA